MSERDLQRIEVLSKVIDGRMTLVTAAHVLGLSTRQVRRLLERIRTDGAASIRHKAIGRPSNNRISDGVRDYAVTLVRERYTDLSAVSQQQLVALAHHLNSLPRKCLGYRTPRRGVHGTFARLRVIPYPPLVIVALGLDSPQQFRDATYEPVRDATVVASWDAGQTSTFGRKTGDVKRG